MIEQHQQRNCLFFGAWQMCAQFHLPEARVLLGLDHARIDHLIQLRRSWGKRLAVKNHGGNWQTCWQPWVITDTQQRDLHRVCDLLLSLSAPYKIMFEPDTVRVYTNDRTLIDHVTQHGVMHLIKITTVTLVGTPGTVRLRRSAHGLRSYLRARLLPDHTANAVKQYLIAQDTVRLSPSLRCWCRDPRYVSTRPHFFLDHDCHGVVNMLQLIQPGLIRVTQPIQADK